jgi:hypothetical protein
MQQFVGNAAMQQSAIMLQCTIRCDGIIGQASAIDAMQQSSDVDALQQLRSSASGFV